MHYIQSALRICFLFSACIWLQGCVTTEETAEFFDSFYGNDGGDDSALCAFYGNCSDDDDKTAQCGFYGNCPDDDDKTAQCGFYGRCPDDDDQQPACAFYGNCPE